jgi:SAM-dependent methyltransferase
VNAQLVVDIAALVRWELVNHVLTLFSQNHDELERRAGRPLRRLDVHPVESASDFQHRFSIEYRAPLDARNTRFAGGSFHLITRTFTLEHIPTADILAILRECNRLLAPSGVISCSVDMQDHYSFSDPRISVYSFLKYSDRAWRMVNSSLHYQNRLRARDYLGLFQQADLRVVDCQISESDAANRERLRALRLAARFARDYSPEELAGTSMLITARGSGT